MSDQKQVHKAATLAIFEDFPMITPSLFDGEKQLLDFVQHWGCFATNWRKGLNRLESLLATRDTYPCFYLPGMLNFVIDFAPSNALAFRVIKRLFPKILAYHRFIVQHFDPAESGLLWMYGPNNTRFASPLVQSIWLWSTQTLIHLGGQIRQEITPLVLEQELSIFQTQQSLWEEVNQRYVRMSDTDKVLPSASHESLLTLFGLLPSQEVAEMMLIQLHSIDLEVVSPGAALLIYHGLQAYHIDRAAQNWMADWQENHLEKLSKYPGWGMLVSL